MFTYFVNMQFYYMVWLDMLYRAVIDYLSFLCRYCDPSYTFPSQQDVINFSVRTSLEFLQVYPAALIVVGSYTIGKERLFHGISYHILQIVSVSELLTRLLKILSLSNTMRCMLSLSIVCPCVCHMPELYQNG